MKIGRIQAQSGVHLGAVVTADEKSYCLDLTKIVAEQDPASADAFRSMTAFIEAGKQALETATNLTSQMRDTNNKALMPVSDVRWLVPVEQPRNFICAGRNFGSHHKESAQGWKKEGVTIDRSSFPTGFAKLPGTLVGDEEIVQRPAAVTEMDYEIEVAAVVGKPAKNLDEDEALDYVFGYTVFIDLSARDWQRQEMRNQMLLLGKNFPRFGPLGPWILTADEVSDPSELILELHVNGELRQQAGASDMIFNFPQLIAFWSQIGFMPGDLVASGTPEGVAMHHAGTTSWYLNPGDSVVGSVSQIGDLHITIA